MLVQNASKIYIEFSVLFRQQTYIGCYQNKLFVEVTFCWLCSWIIELTPNYMSLKMHWTDILNINRSKHAFLLFTSDCPKHNEEYNVNVTDGNTEPPYLFIFHNSVGNKHTFFVPFPREWLPVLHSKEKCYRQLHMWHWWN